jgi:hypothetical protein
VRPDFLQFAQHLRKLTIHCGHDIEALSDVLHLFDSRSKTL